LIQKNGRIVMQIGIEPGLSTEETVIAAVGRAAHEVAHLFAERALEKFQNGEAGVPLRLEEAWVAQVTSKALRYMKLDRVADAVDLATAERIIELQDSQAFYVTYENMSAAFNADPNFADRFAALVKANRNIQIIVVASQGASNVRLNRILSAKGISIVSANQIRQIKPIKGETNLEAHARLNLGTRRVKLVSSDAKAFKSSVELMDLVSVNGKLVEDLVSYLSPVGLTNSLAELMKQQVADRLIGRQA
jgi:hypothetical protein